MPQVVRVLVWEDVLPAERRVDTDVERFGEGDELVARVARTASGYHDRTARLAQPPGNPPDILGHGPRRRGFGPIVRDGDVLTQHIRRQGEHDRARTA
jgi:hypothetical protein